MPLLEEVLAEAGAGWHDLAALGIGTGPGNFTGTRIAVAAGRGLALGLGIPAEGVTVPEAYAEDRDVIVCLPGPRDMVHLSHAGEIVTTEGTIPPGWSAPLTGPAAEALGATTGRVVVAAPDLATAIARIAARRAAPGRPRPAPYYLRPADAAPPADAPPAILP